MDQPLENEIREFVSRIPKSANLEWTADRSFIRHFEAARIRILKQLLEAAGISNQTAFNALDIGYLHGVVPEFIHRNFPNSQFTIFDQPQSPNFANEEYLRLIRQRTYLELIPRDIAEIPETAPRYRAIFLLEVIEHLNPTQVPPLLRKLRSLVSRDGILLIGTPNAAGIYNCAGLMTGRTDIIFPPVPHPTMGHPHIHLWPPAVLRETARLAGWQHTQTVFYHGREGELFGRSWKHLGSLKHQLLIKCIQAAAAIFPRLRGFYISVFIPDGTSEPPPGLGLRQSAAALE